MLCKWCGGTMKECGCGEGKCAHCLNGQTADPPFNAPLRNVLTEEAVNAFAAYWSNQYRDETLGEFIQRIAQYAVDNQGK